MKTQLMWLGLISVAVVTFMTARPAVEKLPPCCRTNLIATAKFTDKSLFQVESRWTNDAGKEIRLGDLRGKVQIVTMFFATCKFACPLLVRDMQRIEAALPAVIREQTGFVLITFDPERDSPSALRQYRALHHLSPPAWNLLQGGSEDIQEIAALLGVKYKKDSNGDYAHSNVITVLNPQGEIVWQQPGLNQDAAGTVKAVVQAAGN
jgi:protein SCO1/2